MGSIEEVQQRVTRLANSQPSSMGPHGNQLAELALAKLYADALASGDVAAAERRLDKIEALRWGPDVIGDIWFFQCNRDHQAFYQRIDDEAL